MAEFKFDSVGFSIDGENRFMNSGEFHYFRVPPEDWKRRMELFKAAGGNCIATYVPWLIHEPTEGNMVFGDLPSRDICRFLETAREVGLKVVLRPGPYQYSELRNAGLPTWLIENYPEVSARNIHGHAYHSEPVSYLHPVFLQKARKYYKAFADVVRPYIGDPVVMLQTDNELGGVQIWHGSIDYHPETMGFGKEDGRYPIFLKKKYGNTKKLNKAYNTDFESFLEVMPLDGGDRTKPEVCRRMRDYFDFYCMTLAEYMCLLTSWLREDGLSCPICHNAANCGMNSMFLETVDEMSDGFLLGSDHYYTLDQNWGQNNPTPQYALSCFLSLEQLRLMGMPPSVLEMPGGSLSDTPPILPNDLLACYMTNLAMGMKGVNYYVYTGGPNFEDTGTTCDIYDYNAHVRADGSLNQTYESLKTFGEFLQNHGWMQRGYRRGSAVIGFEWDVTRSGWYERNWVDFSRSSSWDFARKGLIYTMMCGKYSPELNSLDKDLDLNRSLIVASPTVMSLSAQQKLVEYVENGGKLILFGTLPKTDENYESCTLLCDFLGNPKLSKPKIDDKFIINFPSVGNIYNMTQMHAISDIPSDGEILCTEIFSKETVGFKRKIGRGEVAFIACTFKMQTFDQAKLMENLLADMGAKPCVSSSNRNIFTSLWEDEKGNEVTFVMNLYSSPQSTKITVYDKEGNISRCEEVSLAPMEVKTIE